MSTGYYYVLQGQYGQGWEDLTADDDKAVVRDERRTYEREEGGIYRIVRRRNDLDLEVD